MPAQTITAASLTSFDWFLILIVVLSTVAALLRGFIKVVLSLAGLILGLLAASWNYLSLATHLQRWVSSPPAAQVIAFVLILALVMVLFSLIARLLRRTASAVGLGFLDRILGAAFGLVRGVLLGVVAMMAIAAFLPTSSWPKNSRLAPYFLAGAHALSFVVPEHFQNQIRLGARHLVQQSPDVFRQHPFIEHM